MYNEFFGFQESPFNITPDPGIFYSNAIYQRAYSNLLAGICDPKGVAVLTGEIGTGKTTLLRLLMRNLDPSFHFTFCPYTFLTFTELLDFICIDLGLPDKPHGNLQKLESLYQFLLVQKQQGRSSALLLDEAHNLPLAVLDSLCFFLNLSVSGEMLLPITLVGQPQLTKNLTAPELAHFRRYITVSCQLDRLEPSEVSSFIFYRLQEAGSQNLEIFPPQVIHRIAEYSQGIPRNINIICDNALLIAHTEAKHSLTEEIIEEVARDLQFTNHFSSQVAWQEQEKDTVPVDAAEGFDQQSAIKPSSSEESDPPPIPVIAYTLTEESQTDLIFSASSKPFSEATKPGQATSRFFTRQRPQLVTWAALGSIGIFLFFLFSHLSHPITDPIESNPPLVREIANAATPLSTVPPDAPQPPVSAIGNTPISPTATATSEEQNDPAWQIRKEIPLQEQLVMRTLETSTITNTQPLQSVASDTIEAERSQVVLAPTQNRASLPDPFQKEVPEEIATPLQSTDKKQQPQEIAKLSTKNNLAMLSDQIEKKKQQKHVPVTRRRERLFDNENELLKQAAAGNLLGVKALLKDRTSPNTKDRQGWTPLMIATMNGHTDVVHALLKSGANVNEQNATGRTALMIAALAGHDAILQALLDTPRVDANTTNVEGWTALMYAAWNGHTKIVQSLLQKGAQVNAKNIEGWTPLMYAVHNGHVDTTRALLAGQARPTVTNRAGESAVTFAARRGDIRLRALLRAATSKE